MKPLELIDSKTSSNLDKQPLTGALALGGGHFAGGCVAYFAAQRQCFFVVCNQTRIMIRRILFIFLFQLLNTIAFGQLCGGSFNEINFFVLNGSKIEVIEYEVLPLDNNHLDKIFLKSKLDSIVQTNMRNSILNGIYFSKPYFDQTAISDIRPFKTFRDAVDNAADVLNEQNKRHGLDTVQIKGVVKEGKLIFPTIELYDKRFLLKIACNGHVGAYIIDLFGGCGNHLNLVYNPYSGFQPYTNAQWLYMR